MEASAGLVQVRADVLHLAPQEHRLDCGSLAGRRGRGTGRSGSQAGIAHRRRHGLPAPGRQRPQQTRLGRGRTDRQGDRAALGGGQGRTPAAGKVAAALLMKNQRTARFT